MKTNQLNQHPASCDIITKHHDLTDLTLFSRLKSSTSSSSSQWHVCIRGAFWRAVTSAVTKRRKSQVSMAFIANLSLIRSAYHIPPFLLADVSPGLLCCFSLKKLWVYTDNYSAARALQRRAECICIFRVPWLFITSITIKEVRALQLTGET